MVPSYMPKSMITSCRILVFMKNNAPISLKTTSKRKLRTKLLLQKFFGPIVAFLETIWRLHSSAHLAFAIFARKLPQASMKNRIRRHSINIFSSIGYPILTFLWGTIFKLALKGDFILTRIFLKSFLSRYRLICTYFYAQAALDFTPLVRDLLLSTKLLLQIIHSY